MDAKFWQTRYENNQTGWDTGEITKPIKDYFDKIKDKDIKILIPGCGNAHEAVYLWEQGFRNVYLCDWAAAPLARFSETNPRFPKEQLLHENFFELAGVFDYIIEQTFFCALPINMRGAYAQKMQKLLVKNGKLVGLLFSKEFAKKGPPYGGTKEEYQTYFEPNFSVVNIENCNNSIQPRLGAELFIEITK